MSVHDLDRLDRALQDDDSPAKGPGPHPDVDELMLYVSGEMPSDQQNEMRRHLIQCQACTSAVLDMQAFPEVEERGPLPTYDPERKQQDWEAISKAIESPSAAQSPADHHSTANLNEHLRAPSRIEEAALPSTAQPPPVVYRSTAGPWWVAAVFALATVGLGSYFIDSRSRGPEGLAMQVNVLVYDLLSAAEGGTRSDQTVETIEVSPSVTSLVLILNVDEPPNHPAFGVVLRTGGGVVLEQEGLEAAPEGSYSVSLPRALLDAGSVYELQILGRDLGSKTALQSYFFRIRLDDSSSR